jgi:ribosome biogenesis GTPase
VGDWVILRTSSGDRNAAIDAILPRRSVLSRKLPGKTFAEQVLCANVDLVFVVTSLNQELNLRRLERYLAIAWESGAHPVVLLTKADLCADPQSKAIQVTTVAPSVSVLIVSVITGDGLSDIVDYIKEGMTAVFVGSSGVGKSTLINAISGSRQRVAAIRADDDHGRHTTTARQMILLPQGGIVIDTPGMRELGLYQGERGMAQAFADVHDLAAGCRFTDCRHQTEPGCAVQQAIDDGLISRERLKSFQKLQAELRFLESKTDPVQKRKAKEYAKKMCSAQKRFYK